VARNALSKNNRTLLQQINKDKDKDYPIMIKNFYMSPYYLFGWRNIAKDMEAQNFFIVDD